jgi:DNA-directed RNA polymerase subunit M/transcription elongation factor TFIIS
LTENHICSKCNSHMLVDRKFIDIEIFICPNCNDIIPVCPRCNNRMLVDRPKGVNPAWNCTNCPATYSPLFSKINTKVFA